MSDRATRFLQAFTTIEQELRARAEHHDYDPKHLSFPTLLERSQDLTERQVQRLRSYAELRNAIVHNPRDDNQEIIADPRESTVAWLEKQVEVILNPPQVMAVLNLKKPTLLDADNDLGTFLRIVKEKSFSQVPVLDDGALHLITTNIVTRWLAAEYIDDRSALVEKVRVGEILRFAELSDTPMLAPRNLTAARAVQIFAGMQGRSAPAAIIITEHGQNHQAPIGLCSQSDVAKLLLALGV